MFAPKQRSPKRKPFVSTAKRTTTFGTPPPLPPLTSKEGDLKELLQEELIDIPEVHHHHDEEGVPSNHLINFARFYEMSVRWINMSTTLWSMIVGNSSRKIVRQSLHNFIIALYWRLNGSISEEEFHCLYQEWRNKRTSGHKSQNCDVFALRDCLLEQSTTEDDLEIFLGIIIFETNKGFINSPLSYHSPRAELCSTRWLSLSEELFFLLDTPGHGYLGFDGLVFLSLCLISSSQTWKSETDLDVRLSLTNVTAVTVQLMREAGSDVYFDSTLTFSSRYDQEQISPEKQGTRTLSRRLSVTYDGNGHRVFPESPFGGVPQVESRPQSLESKPHPASVGILTLPMFKRLLIKRSVGETSLVALVSHLKECIQRLIAISEEKGVDVLYAACVHDSTNGADISAPKLWNTCIEAIFGYSPTSELPPILLHLLTDACVSLPLYYVAFPSDASDAVLTFLGDLRVEVRNLPQELQEQNQLVLNSATLSIWSSFLSWGAGEQANNDFPEMDSRDSVYQLISCVVSEYKSSLHFLCAAFIDIAMETDEYRSNPVSHSSGLQNAINLLLPEAEDYRELLQVVLKPFTCATAQNQSHDFIRQSEVGTDSHAVPETDEAVHQVEERNQSDWQANVAEEISNAVWASVFDVKDHVRYPAVSLRSPVQSSPTINFVERRRKRRSQRGKFSQSHDSQRSLCSSPEAVRLEFDGHSSRDRETEEKSMVSS
jgi:hypothetical protein